MLSKQARPSYRCKERKQTPHMRPERCIEILNQYSWLNVKIQSWKVAREKVIFSHHQKKPILDNRKLTSQFSFIAFLHKFIYHHFTTTTIHEYTATYSPTVTNPTCSRFSSPRSLRFNRISLNSISMWLVSKLNLSAIDVRLPCHTHQPTSAKSRTTWWQTHINSNQILVSHEALTIW